jgi:hypothetical protein
MQRVLRDEGRRLVNPDEPAALQALVHRHCPPSIGHLLATPKMGRDGVLEWWTELPGQPCRLAELSGSEQAQLKERLNQRLAALASLGDELTRRGDSAAETMRALPSRPAEDGLYSVGGDPLLIRWVPTVPIDSTAPETKPTGAPLPLATPVARRRRRWLLPIGLPLLLGALALIGLWLALSHWQRFSLPWSQPDAVETATPAATDALGRTPAVRPAVDQAEGAEPALGTGEIQVTLRWGSTDDLDLAVIDPFGDIAFFNSPVTASGGRLDVDSNAGCTPSSQAPVENVFWNSASTPEGTYVATVSLFSRCSDDSRPIPFELAITLDGNTETLTGTVSDQSPRQSFEFSFPPGS